MLSHDEYQRALRRIEHLMVDDPEPGTEAGRELTSLVDVVLDYEQAHYPMFFPPFKHAGSEQPT